MPSCRRKSPPCAKARNKMPPWLLAWKSWRRKTVVCRRRRKPPASRRPLPRRHRLRRRHPRRPCRRRWRRPHLSRPGKIRRRITRPFMSRWPRMGAGWRSMATVMPGARTWPRTRPGVPTSTAAGCGVITVGRGAARNPSAGPAITMVAGCGCRATAGSGYRVANGRRPGCLGGRDQITSAGRRCRPGRRLVCRSSRPTATSPTASVRAATASSKAAASAAAAT